MGFGKGTIYSKKYKYVSEWKRGLASSPPRWQICMPGVGAGKYKTEREAAIAVDKYLISIGKEPVNILKRKKN